MLTDKEGGIVERLVYLAEEYIEEGGNCDHTVGICFCAVTALVMEGYEILHANGFGEHVFVEDFDWDSDDELIRVQRCEKCYVEKSAAKTKAS